MNDLMSSAGWKNYPVTDEQWFETERKRTRRVNDTQSVAQGHGP